MLALLAVVAEVAGYAAMRWKSHGMDFLANGSYFRIRDMLMGNPDPATYPKYLSQPYTVYIPFPGYAKYDSIQHNPDGYRGAQVPLLKGKRYRILCLGGSTTYGYGVKYASQTYPARLDSILNAWAQHDSLFSKYEGVEVINGGIEAASSAEELADYTYKFRYYKPDLVILHSGGNDALISPGDPNYQPDYSHFRRMDFNLKPLPGKARWLMHSYFCSFVIINLFYERSMDPTFYFQQDGTAKYCHWDQLKTDSLIQAGNMDYYAFYGNFNNLVREIRSDSADVLEIPFVLNPNDGMVQSNEEYRRLVALNNQIMQQSVDKYGGHVVPFAYDSIPDKTAWLDDCHVNETGERIKALLVANTIRQQIVKSR